MHWAEVRTELYILHCRCSVFNSMTKCYSAVSERKAYLKCVGCHRNRPSSLPFNSSSAFPSRALGPKQIQLRDSSVHKPCKNPAIIGCRSPVNPVIISCRSHANHAIIGCKSSVKSIAHMFKGLICSWVLLLLSFQWLWISPNNALPGQQDMLNDYGMDVILWDVLLNW